VRAFYRSCGALLAVLHALRAVDAHRENLIACGERTVLVDGETVLHPEARRMDGADESAHGAEVDFAESVIRTQLLPRWIADLADGQTLDVSALGGGNGDQADFSSWRWRGINRDDMRRTTEGGALRPSENEASLDGLRLSAVDHVDDLVGGFTQAYRHLVRVRGELLRPEGPLEAFRGVRVRFIFRITRYYMAFLEEATRAENLRDGVRFGIALDAACRAFLDVQERPRAWPIARAEITALERLDVPCFSATPESDALTLDGGGSIDGYFRSPSLEEVRARVAGLGETDLAIQAAIIRGAFHARAVLDAPGASAAPSPKESERGEEPFGRGELVEEAAAIARRIVESGFVTKDGELRWLGLRRLPGTSRHQLVPLDDSLYDGNAGIALFLAAAARATGDPRLARSAREALRPVRAAVRGSTAALPPNEDGGIGAGTGHGAFVYALVRAGTFLDDGSLLEDARSAARRFAVDVVVRDRAYDVMGGSAGAVLALLALHRVCGGDAELERAAACGDHLLANREGDAGRPRAWRSRSRRPLTGFAHGAAGVSYALAKLGEATGDPRYLEAAAEGIAYERSLFSPAHRNWPDLRDDVAAESPAAYPVGWCAGAAGIGLARIGTLPALGSADVRRDADAALATTEAAPPHELDHVCCGNMSRVETLLAGASALGREGLRLAAARKAAWSVRRARASGGYRILPGLSIGSTYPSFFSGLAGIGYTLLRLASPETVPSVLLCA
jgi:type 2 lantibiotic biosynthesis protein LanM